MQTVRSADGTLIAFDRWGEAPAKLILVGGATTVRRDLMPVSALLAADFEVFGYDRRGRGDSGDTTPYAVKREVEDIDALIDEAGGSAFVFGHSSGAALALEAARLLPDKIRSLAIYEPPFIIDDTRPPAPDDWGAQLEALVTAGRRGDAVELFQRVVGLPPEMIAQAGTSPMWPHFEELAHTLAYDAAVMGDTERGDPLALRRWAGVYVPTLVMDGTLFLGREEGHAFLHHAAGEIARVLPNARRRTLAGQDHGAAPDVLAAELREYFLLTAIASITVDAPVARVWEALTDPEIIQQYMFGTQVVSNWKPGSPIVWRGEWQGKPYEDKGQILRMEPGRTLEYSHFSPLTGLPDTPDNYHTVTIGLAGDGERTHVTLSQDHNATQEERQHSEQNWRMMLEGLKGLLEKERAGR